MQFNSSLRRLNASSDILAPSTVHTINISYNNVANQFQQHVVISLLDQMQELNHQAQLSLDTLQ